MPSSQEFPALLSKISEVGKVGAGLVAGCRRQTQAMLPLSRPERLASGPADGALAPFSQFELFPTAPANVIVS